MQRILVEHKIKVLLGKVGLDAHDRGLKVVASELRERGMEIVYLGIYQRVAGIIRAAIDEDVDVIGIGSATGEYLVAVPKLVEEMKKQNMSDILLLLGGNVPLDDILQLEKNGVDKVFPTDSNIEDIAGYILHNVRQQRK
ncbi:cobalamin B12-binding domain-containing protein [Chloroflexota bacterium]